MTALAHAAIAAVGAYLLLAGWMGVQATRGLGRSRRRLGAAFSDWMARTGLESITPAQYIAASAGVAGVAMLVASTVLGFGLASALIGVSVGAAPTAYWRQCNLAAMDSARESWPRLIEELRVLTGSAGRPIPQALIQVGLDGPAELRPAFVAAQREWALTTDFASTVSVLKARLADPCADATCETLLAAYEVGGAIDSRLAALAEDRRVDLRDRKEADARQAGARLARWFVIIVPLGMGFAGWNLGSGTQAFSSPSGQIAAAAAVLLIAGCWWWAGRVMVVPAERRVFDT